MLRGCSVLLAVAAGLVGCGERTPQAVRGPVPVTSWSSSGGELHVTVPTCDGDPEVTVVETASAVTVSVVSTTRDPGDACLDGAPVPLQEPLGGRAVLDGLTGAEVAAG